MRILKLTKYMLEEGLFSETLDARLLRKDGIIKVRTGELNKTFTIHGVGSS